MPSQPEPMTNEQLLDYRHERDLKLCPTCGSALVKSTSFGTSILMCTDDGRHGNFSVKTSYDGKFEWRDIIWDKW